jgi:hypothetical protein
LIAFLAVHQALAAVSGCAELLDARSRAGRRTGAILGGAPLRRRLWQPCSSCSAAGSWSSGRSTSRRARPLVIHCCLRRARPLASSASTSSASRQIGRCHRRRGLCIRCTSSGARSATPIFGAS